MVFLTFEIHKYFVLTVKKICHLTICSKVLKVEKKYLVLKLSSIKI